MLAGHINTKPSPRQSESPGLFQLQFVFMSFLLIMDLSDMLLLLTLTMFSSQLTKTNKELEIVMLFTVVTEHHLQTHHRTDCDSAEVLQYKLLLTVTFWIRSIFITHVT